MAQKTVTFLVDDLEGGDADETVKFGLDGTEYEIDLKDKNAKALRESLAKFTAAARRVGKAGRTVSGRGRGPATADREQNRAIREWAKRKGIKLSDRGRIPGNIIEQYQAEAGR